MFGALLLPVLWCATPLAHAFGVAALENGSKGVEKRQVAQSEQQWKTALLSGDSATLDNLLSDSYVGIGPDGNIVNKAEEIQSSVSGENRLQKVHVEDRKIRIYDTTAVVTSRVLVQGTYDGQPLLGEYRYTRVWSLQHGQWRIVSFEANRVHDSTSRRD